MIKIFCLFSITFFLFACSKNTTSIIVNGNADLSLHDFTIKDEIDLTGEWKFKWLEDDIRYSLVDYDDSNWKTIKVPSFWNSITGTGHGYGWLRLKIKKKVADNLALYLPGCLTSYELYVNEKLVMKNGTFNKEKTGSIPQRLPLFIELPEDENLVIAWRISNFFDYFGGPDNSPRIGLYDNMAYRLSLIKFVDTLIIGAIFSLFIYYLILWMSLKKVTVHLLFSLLCLFIALRILAANYHFESLFHFKNAILFEIRSKIEYLVGFIGWTLIPIIVQILYPFKINRPYTNFIKYGTMLYSLFILFTNANTYSQYIYFYQAFLIFSGCWNLITLIIATIKKKKYAFILLIGFTFILSTVVHDILVSSKILQNYNLLQLGLFAFLSSNSIILSLMFANSFKNEAYLANNLKKEVKLQTQTIENQKKEIEKMLEQKTNMFINLAHETKTPLTLIKNSIDEYIKRTKPDPDLGILKNNVDKLTQDIINYLDSEKLERGQIFYNHEQIIDASQLIEKKILLFNSIANKKGIMITSNVNSNVYIKADPDALDRIINNLLDNAIKYTEKGNIVVELKEKENKAQLSVKDTGIGITEEEQKNIFHPYYQISHEKRNIQGIGMGLYIAKEIIDQLKGEIKVNSRLNEGSIFTVILPLHNLVSTDTIVENYELKAPLIRSEKLKIEQEEYDSSKDCVFVVEDNIELLSFIYKSLVLNHNVFIAQSGVEALKKLNIIPKPDIILSDIMMDDMDGYQFYEELKKNNEFVDIPFIFLTAKTTEQEKILGLKKGAVDYICKPFSMEELKYKIGNVLTSQKLKKESYINEFGNKIFSLLKQDTKLDKFLKFQEVCDLYKITDREAQIIRFLKDGISPKEISVNLKIAESTVRRHIASIHEKCNIQTNGEMLKLFYE